MTTGSTVNASEVGWQFVPQYYTFLNKHPDRLHCFYTKASTFIHGAEGEDSKPCFGQKEINDKIISIGFENCRVFIHTVDAQLSANNGILIQVIGELSNKSGPWRKFVQTFFLAEQPNGYFVLNDVFRFLKEETVDTDEPSDGASADVSWNLPDAANELAQPQPEEVAVQIPSAPPVTEVADSTSTVNAQETPEAEAQAEAQEAPALEPASEEPEPTPAPVVEAPAPIAETAPQINGSADPSLEAPPPFEKSPTPPPAQPEPPVDKAPSPPPPVPAPNPPAPIIQAPPPPAAAPAPAPAPLPPQPKTWANLAATNSKKWGSAVAQEVRATTEVLAPAVAPSPAPASNVQNPANAQPRNAYPKGDATSILQSIPHAQVFIKGVIETVSDAALKNALNRFGPLKEVDIVRSKACAFAEFNSVEHAKKAILVSQPVNMGGEGGVRIDIGEGNFVRIHVETKKERGERPVSNRGRGGPPNGERGGYGGYGEGRGDRGGFRGGRGGQRGRGGSGGK